MFKEDEGHQPFGHNRPGFKGVGSGVTQTQTYVSKKCHDGNVKLHLDKKHNLEFWAGGSTRGVTLLDFAIHIDLANVWRPLLMSNCGFALKYARKYDFINLGWKDFESGSMSKDEWAELIAFLKERGKSSKKGPQKVLVACMGGHGRTGSALAILAGLLEWTKDDPVKFIRDNYCEKVVESDKQIEQIKDYTGLDVQCKPSKDHFFTTGGTSYFTAYGARYAIPDDQLCQDPICKHRGYAHSQMSGTCLINDCSCRMFDMGGTDFKPPEEKVDAESRNYTDINKSGGLVKCPDHLKSKEPPQPGKIAQRGSKKAKAELAASVHGQTAASTDATDGVFPTQRICICHHPRYMHNELGKGKCVGAACTCPSFLPESITDESGADISDSILDPTLQDLPVTFNSNGYWWCPQCLCAVAKPFRCAHCSKERQHYQRQATELLTGRR